MRRMTALSTVLLLVGALSLPAEAKKAKPVTLWEDAEGDADMAQGVPWGTQPGFDITKGEVVRNKKNLDFTVTHAAMPPTGTPGESFRFLWAFVVNDTEFRITAKSWDIGDPDLPNGETTERLGQVDLQGHFRLEGNCQTEAGVGVNFINCDPLAYVDGSFDPASASFTVTIPMKLMKAKRGSVVGPSGGDGTAICAASACWVTHAAERSAGNSVIDSAVQAETYKIP